MKSWVWNRKKIAIILILACATAVFVSFALLSKPQLKTGAFKNFNVLLITLDTTRADHLPIYGYKGVKTPNLDRLAGESYVFDDAVSHVPLTLPAHTSILTGMLPLAHGIRDNAGFFVDEKIVTLPEILKEEGYSTSAFVSAFVLDSRWRLNQGFDVYHDYFSLEEFNQLTPQDAQRTAVETASEAEQWLKNHKGGSFFSWVHFYDPHDPYNPPEPFKTEYSSRLYDGEIAYMDVAIGKLLHAVSSSGLERNTIVIVTADHGEGLGEHEEETHAMFVYDTTQRVPLLVRIPGMKGQRLGILARHIDLAPTILDLLGIQKNNEMQGSSLIPLMKGGQDFGRSAYRESMYSELHFGWSPVRSLVTSRFQYIDLPRPELYDRIQDPAEAHNLINQERDTAKSLKTQLDKIVGAHPNISQPQKMDPEMEAGLRALGYIGTVGTGRSDRTIDPKDRIHLARKIQVATAYLQTQQYKEAIPILLAVMKEDPAITDAHFLAGVAYIGLEQYDQAIPELNKSLATRPKHVMSLYNLGYAHERKGEEREALRYFLAVLKEEPLHFYANFKTGYLYRRAGEAERARPYFLNVASRYQRLITNTRNVSAKSALYTRLGEAYFGAGNVAQAEKQFRSAIDLTPQRPDLHFNLGSIYEVEGNVEAATRAYLREIELNSENYRAFNNLGLIYRRAGRLEDAATCFERIINLIPNERRGYVMLASVYQEMGRVQEASDLLKKFENKTR